MNARQLTPAAQLTALMSRFPADVVALAKRCLPKLRRAFPGSLELIYNYSSSLVIAFGMSERGSEAIVAVSIVPQGIRLYFDKSLPDPGRRLEGSGGKVRSVAVKTASELDHGDINALINAAIKHSGVAFPRAGTTRKVIKSKAKKRTARKAGRTTRPRRRSA